MKARAAKNKELIHALNVLMEYDEEGRLEEEPTKRALAAIYASEGGCVLLAFDDDGAPVGVVVGIAAPAVFAKRVVGKELALVVKKSHWGSTAAVRLGRAFEKWCHLQGVDEIEFSPSEWTDDDTLRKIYEGSGYKLVSRRYRKEL